jgi:hypothetical protein
MAPSINCIQEGMIPTKCYSKTAEHLSSANGSQMQIDYKLSKAHVCQDNVCFKTSFVLIKNMPDSKVILGNPFLCLLCPFTTDHKGITTEVLGQKVKFKFFQKPMLKTLICYKKFQFLKQLTFCRIRTNI